MKENQVRSGIPAGTQKRRPETAEGTQKPQTLVADETQEKRSESFGEAREPAREGSGAQTAVAGPACGTKARRSGRITKEIPILLIGSDSDGRVLTEEARTAVLSLHGAGIVSRHRLIPEQEVVLRLKEEKREAVARVVGEIAQQGERQTYGVAFVDEKLDFWKIEFPPAPEWDERPLVLTLECGGCREDREEWTCRMEILNMTFAQFMAD